MSANLLITYHILLYNITGSYILMYVMHVTRFYIVNCFYCFVLFYFCAFMYIDMFYILGFYSHRGSIESEINSTECSTMVIKNCTIL
jgi:hypothetical protein